MMETEEKYKVVIVDDERTAIDALRRELEPYREFEVKGIAGNGAKGKKMIMELHRIYCFSMWSFRIHWGLTC